LHNGQKQPLLSANEALWSAEFLRQRLLFAAACIDPRLTKTVGVSVRAALH
jgi:hypothetical protein